MWIPATSLTVGFGLFFGLTSVSYGECTSSQIADYMKKGFNKAEVELVCGKLEIQEMKEGGPGGSEKDLEQKESQSQGIGMVCMTGKGPCRLSSPLPIGSACECSIPPYPAIKGKVLK
jgi:hypothetical protein